MSAHTIFDNAPIGAFIAWSDGTPEPPTRFKKKLAAWKVNNCSGRLTRKQGQYGMGNLVVPASFTLHEGDFGSAGSATIRIFRTFSVVSALRFTVLERPALGSVRVFNRDGEGAELVHLAAHRAAAEEWLSRHGYPRAVLQEVDADEIGADVVEGRAAA